MISRIRSSMKVWMWMQCPKLDHFYTIDSLQTLLEDWFEGNRLHSKFNQTRTEQISHVSCLHNNNRPFDVYISRCQHQNISVLFSDIQNERRISYFQCSGGLKSHFGIFQKWKWKVMQLVQGKKKLNLKHFLTILSSLRFQKIVKMT